MFKLIKRVICLLLIVGVLFITLSLWQGGKPFRWVGKKSEKAGEVIKEKSEAISKEADRIKEKTEQIKDATKKVTKGIEKTGEKIKGIRGEKDENEAKK
ncbi:MAG: hypothetical protein ACOYU0_01575 [Nitrospirota bacterium]